MSSDKKIISTNTNIDDVIPFEIKGYFIDLDGTTLDKRTRGRISRENINVITKINEEKPVVISTGRAYGKRIKKAMELLDLKYAICQNGAVIVDWNGQILKNVVLDSPQLLNIKALAEKYNLSFNVNSQFLIYSNSWIFFLLRLFWRNRFKSVKKFNAFRNDVNKIVFAGKSRKKILNLFLKIKDQIPNTSIKISGNDLIIEITNEEATKGNGAKFVANLLNIDPKKTIHIGDSQNDTTTLEIVGALVAMENSSQHLLDVATHVGPNYKKGGLAKVLKGEIKKNRQKQQKNKL